MRTRSGPIALLLAVVLCLGCGPIGPFSGGRLSGEDAGWLADWSGVSEITQIQLETSPDDPHSVNVWVVVVDQEAYLATSLLIGTEVPEEREWVRNVTTDPRVRLRIEGRLYSAQLETVTDESLKARVFEAFLAKYPEIEASRGGAARFFRVNQSRSG